MEIVKNNECKGIELYFESKPEKNIINLLKNASFRWHNLKKCWYAKENTSTLKLANKISSYLKRDITTLEFENSKKIENELNIKIGDIFYTSWGYEQTNINFFRVIGLKGKTQVILQEVALKEKEVEEVSGMSRDVKFYTEEASPVARSVFIEDNDKGIIKKVKGTKENPYISLEFSIARLYKGQKLYESWYY